MYRICSLIIRVISLRSSLYAEVFHRPTQLFPFYTTHLVIPSPNNLNLFVSIYPSSPTFIFFCSISLSTALHSKYSSIFFTMAILRYNVMHSMYSVQRVRVILISSWFSRKIAINVCYSMESKSCFFSTSFLRRLDRLQLPHFIASLCRISIELSSLDDGNVVLSIFIHLQFIWV